MFDMVWSIGEISPHNAQILGVGRFGRPGAFVLQDSPYRHKNYR